ncbi:MAG: family 78 glycoside hydrolase catalytic domain [Planctomycetes bacterium]|nr:family 78 glycoside hydrolase catalytic domain [Planctomycetota bacterium]
MAQAVKLRCEYRERDLAVENLCPRLSWQVAGEKRGTFQAAYQIQAAGSAADLEAGRDLLWDSGAVPSQETLFIPWGGAPLGSFQRVFWRVRLTARGEAVPGPWSAPAEFAMGVLPGTDWPAQRVFSPLCPSPNCPYFRKAFALDRPVAEARLYATAWGAFTARVNGRPVADDWFAPGWTDYGKTQLYRVYDVTAALAQGENVLGVQLGDGWYKGPIGWQGRAMHWGEQTMIKMFLRVTYADGEVATIGTDASWKTHNSPVLSSTFMRGEHYDATLEMPGWDRPGYDDAGWLAANVCEWPEGVPLTAHPGEPVRVFAELKPERRWQARPGVWVFDFGQNFAGVVRMRLRRPAAGTMVRLRFAEMVMPDDNIYVDNLRQAVSTDFYVCAGREEEVWQPTFTFHGFQYLEVSGLADPQMEDFTGLALSSGCAPAGSFSCSDPLINRLYANTVWTQRANYLDVPTDCPQRDERLGWTGDAQAFIRTGAWNLDVNGFFAKWLQDLRDSQNAAGAFANVAPNLPCFKDMWPTGADAAWGDAGTICPWTIYQVYGDRKALADAYPAMRQWVKYLGDSAVEGQDIRVPGGGRIVFGDWLSMNAHTPNEIVMTAFYAYSLDLTARAAAVLGHADHAAEYQRKFADVKAAFNRLFVAADGSVHGLKGGETTQTACLLALHFGLVEGETRAKVFARLVDDLARHGNYLTTGFAGLPYLLPELTRGGRPDLAYALLFNRDCPSWLYPVTQGATTIWERWDGWKKGVGPNDPCMNSFSHYAYGAVGEWLYSAVCGVETVENAFARLRVAPEPTERLEHAKMAYDGPRGRVVAEWRRVDGGIEYTVEIPANCEAEVSLPGGAVTEGGAPVAGAVAANGRVAFTCPSGRYVFMAR